MWDLQHLKISTACYRDSFNFFLFPELFVQQLLEEIENKYFSDISHFACGSVWV
jgi:hypothetical protein